MTNLAQNLQEGRKCQQLYAAVLTAAIDEFIGYPKDRDRLGRYATQFKIKKAEYKKHLPKLREYARQRGIKEARDWLWSRDADTIMIWAGIEPNDRTKNLVMEFIERGIPTNRAVTVEHGVL